MHRELMHERSIQPWRFWLSPGCFLCCRRPSSVDYASFCVNYGGLASSGGISYHNGHSHNVQLCGCDENSGPASFYVLGK